MSSTFRLGGVLLALVLVLVACAGPGAVSPSPRAPGAQSPAAPTAEPMTPEATEPAESPEATEPAESPEATEAGESPEATEPAETAGITPEPTAPPAGVEGTLTLWVDELRAPYMLTLGEEFEAATGVPVAVHQLGFGDIRDQLQLRGPAGEGPDIIIGAHDWLGQLVTNGLVEPLEIDDTNIDPVALQAFTYDGQLYGVPYASEAVALYYNPDLVPEPPATWDELKQMAQQLQDEQGLEQAYVLQTGPADPYHSYPILSGHGGYIFGEDAEGNYDPSDVGLDSEGGLAYARELDQMIVDGLLRADVSYDTMISLFTSGEAAMFMTGPWQLTAMRDSGAPFDIAQIPTMEQESRPFVGVQAFMVSAFAPNKTLAETFLTEYIATDDTMAALFEADPRPPTWLPQQAQVTDEQVLAFVESASNGDPMPSIPEMSSVWTDWTDALNLIFTQGQDPEQAVQDAAESIRGLIGPTESPGASPTP